MDEYTRAFEALADAGVRFVLIGLAGVNLYAAESSGLFATEDRDLFLPEDEDNLLRCWQTLQEAGWSLWSHDEPLGVPIDLSLARAVVSRKASISATHPDGLTLDLTLTMAGYRFSEVWQERRILRIEETEVPVARLRHILGSKRAAGRPKDLLFLATHEEALKELLRRNS